jgi:hypothetical protein
MLIGLIVDGVSEVRDILAENVVPPPSWQESQNPYISGVGKLTDGRVVLLAGLAEAFFTGGATVYLAGLEQEQKPEIGWCKMGGKHDGEVASEDSGTIAGTGSVVVGPGHITWHMQRSSHF